MAENCTIYCRLSNLEEIARVLNLHFPSSNSAVGDSLMAHGNNGSLCLTQKAFHEPGDGFCRMILGIRAFIKCIDSADPSMQQMVVKHLDLSDVAIGVVAEPSFDADERYHDVVFAIAKVLDGLVFNGQEILNADGMTLVTES